MHGKWREEMLLGGGYPGSSRGKGPRGKGGSGPLTQAEAQPGGEKLEGVEQKGKKLACRRGKGQNTALPESNPT